MLKMNFFAHFGIIIASTCSLHFTKKMMSGDSHGEASYLLGDERYMIDKQNCSLKELLLLQC